MSADHQPQLCKRPGCRFGRSYIKAAQGGYRRQRHCSLSCYVWCRRASGAVKHGDATEAAELLRLSDLLDTRRAPTETVAGVITGDKSQL